MDETPHRSDLADPADLADRLRHAVVRHGAAEVRRVHPAVVRVGDPRDPAGTVASWELAGQLAPPAWDHALRLDALGAAVRRLPVTAEPALVWLTRTGGLETQDLDLAWCAATTAASGEHDVPLLMAVVTRFGWHLPAWDLRRQWVRPRRGRWAPTDTRPT